MRLWPTNYFAQSSQLMWSETNRGLQGVLLAVGEAGLKWAL